MKRIHAFANSVYKNDFIKVSSLSAIAMVVRMITGFISMKIVAKLIGPAGIALTGQFINSVSIIGTLGSGCIGQGVTKYVAEHYDSPTQQNKFISNSIKFTLICSVVVSIITILLSSVLSEYIFKTTAYKYLIILLGATVSLYSLNLLLLNILNGFKGYRKYVSINIIGSILSLAITVPVVYYFGLEGALLNCIISQILTIFITIFYIRKEPWFKSIFEESKFDISILKRLGIFTLMALVSSTLSPFVQLFLRGHIINKFSVTDAGMWEGINRLSSMYLLVITGSISTFYLPRLAELKDKILLRNEIFKTMKLVVPPLIVFVFIIYVLRDIIIRMVFSSEFLPMNELFLFQLIGDVLKITSWLIAFLFWAKAMIRPFIITETVFSILLIFLSIQCLNLFGLKGIVYAYAFNSFCYLITILFLFRNLLFSGK